MTNFETAYNTVIKGSEGGYANDSTDKGGETYKGVSRIYNPEWPGWPIVDQAKRETSNVKELIAKLDTNVQLQILIIDFYKNKYWDKYGGDNLNPRISIELFDQAVNFGTGTAVEHLQRTINILNKNQNDYPDITIDKIYGNETHNGYLNMTAHNKCGLIINILNGFQIKRYIEIMERDKTQEKYTGWFGRVAITKYLD